MRLLVVQILVVWVHRHWVKHGPEGKLGGRDLTERFRAFELEARENVVDGGCGRRHR